MEKAKNSLVILNQNYKIANKDMNKQLSKVIEGLEGVERNTWKYACAIHQIITLKLYEDDFHDVETFASYIQTTKSNLYKLTKAVDYAINNNCMEKYSVSRCYILSNIKDMELFQKWCKDNDINIDKLTKNGLEKVVSEYKGLNKKAKDIVDNNESDIVETYTVKYNGRLFDVPIKVLLKYERKQEDKQ